MVAIQTEPAITTTPIIPLPDGKSCLPQSNTPLKDAGSMGLIIFTFVVMSIVFRYGHKYVATISHRMFSVRRRQNAFEDHTMNETFLMITMIINTCVMSGILFYYGVNNYYPELSLSEDVFLSVGLFSLFCGLFIVLQVSVYYLLGYVFSSNKEDVRLWLDGFKSSQALLGVLISPLVFLILLFPGSVSWVLYIAITLYFCSRLIFVTKGFRIFFNNISSCIYFILYLCSVEIVPVFLICAGAIYLSEIIV